MRISTNLLFRDMTSTITTNMNLAADALKNGSRKIHKAGDNPAAESQIMLLQSTISINASYTESANSAATLTKETSSSLDSYKKSTENYLALTEKAINGTTNAEDKRVFAKDLNSIIEQVALTANSKSYTGDYVFAGNNSNSPAFSFTRNSDGNITGFKYEGNDIQKKIVIGTNLNSTVSFNGSKLFSNKDGVSIFSGLIELRDKLEKGESFSPEEATKLKATAKSFNDEAIVKTTDLAIGEKQINTTLKRYESLDISFSTQLSMLQDADLGTVASDIAKFKNLTMASIASMQSILKMSEDILSM
ncbi:hypothetical protein UA38_11425 [Photobacterium kishitanii]|uniref:Flagellin n=1 Tax=Photobacterium kishitanii TaxID=318456 RepID=A0AAX0YP06_9GAMM|nr:hypothetical protein [Photobacterium kishitanii]KJG57177.1 hypothetical protein UA38_11425 [Photobacterium kishitanii]KJG60498.1 hypothetical protein UA42_15230 [Photobacterium kishitanii]KJG64796.1 hypothetical protein UA40_14945 [Photobacterium kishitanii]KJG68992.1 hypothetical protein UA41_14070 [Photobacterium kishitanii]PSX17368.1 hypothetical protein C0W70_20620 [Photobacterium kishitanii]